MGGWEGGREGGRKGGTRALHNDQCQCHAWLRTEE